MYASENEKRDYELLPKRNFNYKFKKYELKRNTVINVFPVDMDRGDLEGDIFSYYLKTRPEIPDDNCTLLKRITRAIPDAIRKEIGIVSASNKMVWGCNETKKSTFVFDYLDREGDENET